MNFKLLTVLAVAATGFASNAESFCSGLCVGVNEKLEVVQSAGVSSYGKDKIDAFNKTWAQCKTYYFGADDRKIAQRHFVIEFRSGARTIGDVIIPGNYLIDMKPANPDTCFYEQDADEGTHRHIQK